MSSVTWVPGERYPLDEALMLQFDQRFTYETLAHPKLLSNFPFNDLFAAPDCGNK